MDTFWDLLKGTVGYLLENFVSNLLGLSLYLFFFCSLMLLKICVCVCYYYSDVLNIMV